MSGTGKATRRVLGGWKVLVPVLAAAMALESGSASGVADTNPVPSTGAGHTYTLDADFDEGSLLNLSHDPGHDQLQLNRTTKPFPFVNIAASARGTAIRIDVDTGAILGEYLTAPDGMGRNPSRTTVDKLGNVWIANRNETHNGRGSVSRIGLVVGGTRVSPAGTADPAGQYVKPPYEYNTCLDRDGDGLIKTSSGLSDILDWSNGGGADSNGGVATATDECIINYTRVAGTGTRTVAVDANNDLWTGGIGDRDHEKVNGVSGLPVPGTQFNIGCGGYGGLVDGNGVLWSARNLLRFVPGASPPPAGTGACLGDSRGNYGLGIDPRTGHIWHSSLGDTMRLYELDADANVVNSYPQPFHAQGVAVDGNGHVWMAELFGSRVWHLAPDPATPSRHVPVGIVGGFRGVTGLAVDANGKTWGAEMGNRASRIDPNAGPVAGGGYRLGAIDLNVDLGPGAGPYNYSDMTGFVAIGATSPQGSWSLVRDGGAAGTRWGKISWNEEPEAEEPAGTSITVEARAADTEAALSAQPFVAVANGVPFAMTGRFLETRTTLKANRAGESPVLSDLTIAGANEAPVAEAGGPYAVPEGGSTPLDGGGSSDADGDVLSFDWDLDGDGTFETSGPGPTFSAAGRDGPGSATATLRVCDPAQACATDWADVVITNVAPGPDAGADQSVFRNEAVALAGTWTDPAAALDDPYRWAWNVPGDLSSGSASYGATVARTAAFATEGSYTLDFSVTDKDGGDGGDSLVVTVLNRPPECSAATPHVSSLWPPNHRMVPVGIQGVTDAEGDPVAIVVTSVRQDEPVNGIADGDTSPDADGVGTASAGVRAERAGSPKVPGNGRVYHVAFSADDGHGGSCSGVVRVGVPHDQRGAPAVDDGPLHDSTLSGS